MRLSAYSPGPCPRPLRSGSMPPASAAAGRPGAGLWNRASDHKWKVCRTTPVRWCTLLADRLKEYTIGLESFGQPSTYDPKHDSIVRLQAGRLRQKLLAYYQTEAAGDAIRVSMPKGAFKLNFEPVEVPDHAHGVPWNPRRVIVLLSAALAVATVWAVASTIGLVRLHRETEVMVERWTPELESLWGPFLQSNRPLMVCL